MESTPTTISTFLMDVNNSTVLMTSPDNFTFPAALAMQPQKEWIQIFNYFQLSFTVLGSLVNLITLITLSINYEGFSRIVLLLLWHQSLVDFLVCIQASILVIQPYMWSTNCQRVDLFICHTWHSQAFYWGAVTLSTYNLVTIAIERYLTICKPVYMSAIFNLTKRKIAIYLVILYTGTLLITHGTYLQTRLVDGKCLHKYFMEGPAVEKYFIGFVVFTYIATYLVPALVMATLYGMVAYKLHKRIKDMSLGKSSIVEAASTQLTKTAVVVTMIFLFSIGYDLHFYLLGYTGVTAYELNTPIQKIGVFLSNTNSCVNPIIYMALMPLYRESIKKTFCCGCSHRRPASLNLRVMDHFHSSVSIISFETSNSDGGKYAADIVKSTYKKTDDVIA